MIDRDRMHELSHSYDHLALLRSWAQQDGTHDDYDLEPDETYTCEWCGADDVDPDGAHEYGCPNQERYWMKGVIPDTTDIDLVAASIEHLAAELRSKAAAGWVVIDNDNGYLVVAKPSDPVGPPMSPPKE